MKRLILILAMLVWSPAAFATCPTTLLLRDASTPPILAPARYADDGLGNCIPYIFFSTQNATPIDCSGTIQAGGSAQTLFAASPNIRGFMIANIDTVAGSGEPLWISLTGVATATAAGSYPLASPSATTFANLSSYTTPFGLGINTGPSVVGATTGHKFSCTRW